MSPRCVSNVNVVVLVAVRDAEPRTVASVLMIRPVL
jgi:hypothetical protein